LFGEHQPIWHVKDAAGEWKLRKEFLIHTDTPGGGSLHPNVNAATMRAINAEHAVLTRPTPQEVALRERADRAATLAAERYRAVPLVISEAVKADLDSLLAAYRTELIAGRPKDSEKIRLMIASTHGQVIDEQLGTCHPASPEQLRALGVDDAIANRTAHDWAGALGRRFGLKEQHVTSA